MKNKRLFWLTALMVIFALAISACSGAPEPAPAPAEEAPAEEVEAPAEEAEAPAEEAPAEDKKDEKAE